MFRRPQYIVLSLVVLTVLVVLNLPAQTAAHLKFALTGLFIPLFGLASATHHLTERAGNAIVPRRALLDQLEQLRRENQRLRLQSAQSQEVWTENARLRQMLGFQKQTHWTLKPARVVGGDPANWWRTLRIGAGAREGLRADLPVLSAEGFLVGRVSEVGQTDAQVALVGDPRCRVAAMVQETRDLGTIVESSASTLDTTFVQLTHLSRNSPIKPGQTVVTSSLGGIFPKGIPVGDIVDVRSVDYGLYLEARVKRAANIGRLEDVWVLMNP